jgi:hypothetical protein
MTVTAKIALLGLDRTMTERIAGSLLYKASRRQLWRVTQATTNLNSMGFIVICHCSNIWKRASSDTRQSQRQCQRHSYHYTSQQGQGVAPSLVGIPFHLVRVDICSPSMPDDLQVANMIFCLFKVSTPLEKIVSFVKETLFGTPRRIQAVTVILLDT